MDRQGSPARFGAKSRGKIGELRVRSHLPLPLTRSKVRPYKQGKKSGRFDTVWENTGRTVQIVIKFEKYS